jgi:hypothetical protein
MKPFSTIAIPHKDVLEGRLTMDVFAADLWEVFQGRAPDEYQDPDVFFRKTYLTAGLKNLLDIAEKRIQGKGGDPIIQLQTPFGGGKTHSLIALYHKAREWKVNVVVIDGTVLDPKDITIWEEMEKQLTGEVKALKGQTSPGREKLKSLFEEYQPLLILMDELLHYTARASGIKVGESSLASQVLAFIQELTGVVKTLERSLLILTLPSSVLEHYESENAERLFQQIQKITGRMEKIYTPVHDEEIASVIRRRLFSSVNENEAKKIIEEFLDYAEKEKILPEGVEKSDYRAKFLKSYPFLPEVIDVLYKRWGSFPNFQRTRGVLRLLALVVHSLKDSPLPYIRLGDFDLGNEEIKRELINHIGEEYSGIIYQDITSLEAGAKKVDRSLGDAYISFSFGTKAATAIFLYSHSGGLEKGATINEIKLSSADVSAPSAIVAEAVGQLKGRLFYLWEEGGKLLFKNQPNLNRILVVKKESISDPDLKAEEERIVKEYLKKDRFEIYVWPKKSSEIPDTRKLKLILMESEEKEKCKEILEEAGAKPRVYRNTLIFLCPLESERLRFENFLKNKKAYEMVKNDKTLALSSEQRKEIESKLKRAESEIYEEIRNLYRLVRLPAKDGFKEIDLGKYTVGEEESIDKKVYQRLSDEKEVLEKITPLILKEKYLGSEEYVRVVNILESFFKTPGELRVTSEEALKESIKEGVSRGLFGLGEIEGEKPKCRYFKTDCFPELVEGEILIRAELCISEEGIPEEEFEKLVYKIQECSSEEEILKIKEKANSYHLSEEQKKKFEAAVKEKLEEIVGEKPPRKDIYQFLRLKLDVPSGKLSDIVRMVGYLKTKFNWVDVKVEITTRDGEISISDYEDKIKETINQSSIEIEEEEIK